MLQVKNNFKKLFVALNNQLIPEDVLLQLGVGLVPDHFQVLQVL